MEGQTGSHGELEIVHKAIPTESMPEHVKAWLKSVGYDAETLAKDMFATRLYAHHFRLNPAGKFFAGKHFGTEEHPHYGKAHELVEARDLGPGAVTMVGANYLANAVSYITGSPALGSIADFNFHAIGTGSVAAAGSDYFLGTFQGTTNLSGTTNGYMTGTQSAPVAASPSTFKTVATFTATGAIACTEWGLTMSNAANFARTAVGTPTATDFPDSGAAFTNTGNKLAGWAIEINATAINTPTTTVWGQVALNAGSNSLTNLHLTNPGWLTLANASASTPGANPAYVVYPAMLDRKVFAAINLVNTDTLAFTYTNAISTGT